MTKRIILSLLLCTMFMGVSFPSSSFALTKEQKQIETRIEMLQSIFGEKRGVVDGKLGPEKVESEECIYTYDKGLTKVNFGHKKKGKPSKKDIVYYITADVPASHKLTAPLMTKVLQGKGTVLQLGGQIFVDTGSYQIIVSFDESGNCKQLQFVKTS